MTEIRPVKINKSGKKLRSESGFRAVRGEAVLVCLVLVLVCVLLVANIFIRKNLEQPQGENFLPAAELSKDSAKTIISRTQKLLGLEAANNYWVNSLASAQAGIAEYLLRLFTSPAYLSGQTNDVQFTADLYHLVTGDEPPAHIQEAAAQVLADSGSRLALINYLLDNLGYTSRLALPPETTRLRTFYLADDRPKTGTELVGKVIFAAEARLTGKQARLKLYADGKIRESSEIETADPTLLNRYQMVWDTRLEAAGSKDLSVLLLTNDGRGHWQEIDTYMVPEVLLLETGVSETNSIRSQQGQANTVWYQLPAQNREALLNILPAETPVEADLFDLYNQPLSANSSHKDLPAALRFQPQEDSYGPDDITYYVRIRPGKLQAADGKTTFSLLPSLAVALEHGFFDKWIPVLALEDDKLQIIDESGSLIWREKTDFELFDATARLMDLTLESGSNSMDYVPGFARNEEFYGLVVLQQTSSLRFTARTMEGNAATLSVRNITEQEPAPRALEGNEILLSASVNRLLFEVTGYNGTQRTYEINVLRPPHSGGYEATLNQFPYTYQSWLWLLHLQRPEYQFAADQIGIDWNSFVLAQAEGSRSLIDAATVPDSWVLPGSPIYDGASWKAASSPVIAYYGDPRNFLDQANIFQFERMTYDPQIHNREGIESMLQDTFMEPGNPENIDYTDLLIKAAREADISPFFLASKIIQEMGRQGQSPLAFGRLEGYEGAYNFYNINSVPNPEIPDGARINGARFALYGLNPEQGELGPEELSWLLPWNTPERAIIGGAIWIAQRYVQVGQDTLYLQKFDLIGSNGLYMRQYAQNIQMAWAEGLRTYRAYAEMELLDQPFSFKIPVFDNLPPTPHNLP